MRKRGLLKTVALALAATMMLTACGGGGDAEAPAEDGAAKEEASADEGSGEIGRTDFIFAMKGDVVSIDPAGQQDTTSSILLRHVYDTLLEVSQEGEIVGDLAESYEISDDGTAFTFKLKENACFADGSPVTAEDVKFTFDRAKNMPKTKSNTSKVDEVVVDNDHQVTIKLSQPYAPFKAIVCSSNLSIVSKAAVEAAGEDYGTVENIMGSGPYVLKEWVPNDHYVLEKNENYWGEEPICTSITCRVIPEGSARAIALETGEVDLVYSVDAIDCANIETNPDVKLLSQPSVSIEYLGMNTQKKDFSDMRVRQAINYAINKQDLVDGIIEGRGVIANTYINNTVPGWSEKVEAYPYDVEKAKELMKEAGYENGFDCKLYVSGDVRTRSAQIIQSQLAEIGINVEISTYEWGAFLDSLNAGEHDMFILGWSNSSYDPDSSTYQLFHSSNHGTTGNRAFLTDDQVDELINQAQVEGDEAKRMQLYEDLQMRLRELAPWCPLYYPEANTGVRADLKGFELHPSLNHMFTNCHYEK